MNIAIYPRKSKKDDNSESMEQQIDDCKKYINKTNKWFTNPDKWRDFD